MNQAQRKDIENISNAIESLTSNSNYEDLVQAFEDKDTKEKIKACANELISDVQELIDQLETHLSDESDKFDNMPEAFQNGERGEAMQEGMEYLQEAIDALEDAVVLLKDAEELEGGWEEEFSEHLENASGALSNI